MYRGFNLELGTDFFGANLWDFKKIGETSIEESKASIKKRIGSFVGVDGSLDGSKMQANWFPQIKADVFISHSHKDLKLAIALAGWLNVTFGLTAFIDSCVWGYADRLIGLIDNKYCRKRSGLYNYKKRNYSTSHVHMMLSVALTQMIDKTECLFFLNTPNSIKPDTIIGQTESPWIYSEIAMSRLIRKKELKEYRDVALMESQRAFTRERENIHVSYPLPVDHLTAIDVNTLLEWKDDYSNSLEPEEIALDTLYELTI
ncbi:hypothetical protein [Hoylesella nanceiensis]|uniref:hypothetical protein n=1 Tax=Hoylesella nanceiensis TaxID=425941 RepID=UPI0028ED22AA|nr:hypothetical protein [Hoylesella nanceiensis]